MLRRGLEAGPSRGALCTHVLVCVHTCILTCVHRVPVCACVRAQALSLCDMEVRRQWENGPQERGCGLGSSVPTHWV